MPEPKRAPKPGQPSEETRAALEKGLSDLDRLEGGWSTSYQRAKSGALDREHHVHLLSLRDVQQGAPLDTAEGNTRGWRFVFPGPDTKPVICEVNRASKYEPPKLTGWSAVPEEMYNRATEKIQAEGAQYGEVRILSIPELQIEALWFKAPDRAGDKLLPLLSAHDEVKVFKDHSPEEFINGVKLVADRRTKARKNFKTV